jgi:hypothetical protein
VGRSPERPLIGSFSVSFSGTAGGNSGTDSSVFWRDLTARGMSSWSLSGVDWLIMSMLDRLSWAPAAVAASSFMKLRLSSWCSSFAVEGRLSCAVCPSLSNTVSFSVRAVPVRASWMSWASNAPGAIDVESLGAVSFASASSVAMRESWSALSP